MDELMQKKKRLPSREEIEKEATRLFMQNNIQISDITPERHELQEEGYLREAQHRLMSSGLPDVNLTMAQATAEQFKYLDSMANEMGFQLLRKRAFKKAEKGMFTLGFTWTNGWTKTGKTKSKPKKVKWKVRGKQTGVLADQWIKFCNELGHPCSMQEFEKFLQPDKTFRQTKRDILNFFEGKRKATKRRERKVKPKKDEIDKMVDAIVSSKPITLPKTTRKKQRKRKKSHVERTGKTPKVLRQPIKNGKRFFSFSDDVWKVRSPRRKRKKRR